MILLIMTTIPICISNCINRVFNTPEIKSIPIYSPSQISSPNPSILINSLTPKKMESIDLYKSKSTQDEEYNKSFSLESDSGNYYPTKSSKEKCTPKRKERGIKRKKPFSDRRSIDSSSSINKEKIKLSKDQVLEKTYRLGIIKLTVQRLPTNEIEATRETDESAEDTSESTKIKIMEMNSFQTFLYDD